MRMSLSFSAPTAPRFGQEPPAQPARARRTLAERNNPQAAADFYAAAPVEFQKMNQWVKSLLETQDKVAKFLERQGYAVTQDLSAWPGQSQPQVLVTTQPLRGSFVLHVVLRQDGTFHRSGDIKNFADLMGQIDGAEKSFQQVSASEYRGTVDGHWTVVEMPL